MTLQSKISQLEMQLANAKAAVEQADKQMPALPTLSQPKSTALANPDLLDWERVRQESYRFHTRYWLETMHAWPERPLPPNGRYVSFAPWQGGFNNIRMSLEMAAAFALATDRTLVLPPSYKMYLRGESAFQDYFEYDHLRRGIRAVDYVEFRKLVNLDRYDGYGVEGPVNSHSMEDYFKGVSKVPGAYVVNNEKWKDLIASQVVYCFPNCPNHTSSQVELDWFKKISYRLKPMEGGTPAINAASIVHFPANLLGHFYTFVWFKDPREGARIKRIIRDHMHYKEEIFRFAEHIVQAMGGDFAFSCLHVRRNDFQFKDVWTPAGDIVRNVDGLFNPGERIYIATDELSKGKESEVHFSADAVSKASSDHKWFQPMFDKWGGRSNVRFWSDFLEPLKLSEVKKIWIGCVESVVCARARMFVGTQKSTFTGYINRMRGYMRDVTQKELFEAQAFYPTDYYKALVGPSWGKFPSGSFGGGHPYWGREYREAWEGASDPLY